MEKSSLQSVKTERETQDRVVALFRDSLNYRYLGNRSDRTNNGNIDEEPTHNSRFQSLMDQHHPKWRSHQQTLNRLPVRHESWGY